MGDVDRFKVPSPDSMKFLLISNHKYVGFYFKRTLMTLFATIIKTQFIKLIQLIFINFIISVLIIQFFNFCTYLYIFILLKGDTINSVLDYRVYLVVFLYFLSDVGFFLRFLNGMFSEHLEPKSFRTLHCSKGISRDINQTGQFLSVSWKIYIPLLALVSGFTHLRLGF